MICPPNPISLSFPLPPRPHSSPYPFLSLSLSMASRQSASQNPLYPQVLQSNPETLSPFISNPNPNPIPQSSSSSPDPTSKPTNSLYPSIDIVNNLFPDSDSDDYKNPNPNNSSFQPPIEESLLSIPGAILHLIDKHRSIELATGDLTVLRLRQGDHVVTVLARVAAGNADAGADAVQWPLTRDEAAVKLDDSHYFFSLRIPGEDADDGCNGLLNYGLTFASKGQEGLLKELDGVLECYSSFSVQKVTAKVAEVLDGSVAMAITPAEVMVEGLKKEMMEERSAAYWTTLAPNVEDYSGLVAKGIALGSGQLIKGIIWCGDVTVDRLKWGNDLLKKRMGPNAQQTGISEDALNRIKRLFF